MLKSIRKCLQGESKPSSVTLSTTNNTEKAYLSEKPTMAYQIPPVNPTIKSADNDAIAAHIILTLRTAEKPGQDLQRTLTSIVHEAGGWSEAIAKRVLAALEATLQSGKNMAPALQHAFNTAIDEARKIGQFASEHPVLTGVFCTVVALGVLWLLWPAVIEMLGFGELGPIEGE